MKLLANLVDVTYNLGPIRGLQLFRVSSVKELHEMYGIAPIDN